MRQSSKASRRHMRNLYRRAFCHYDAAGRPAGGYRRAVRYHMKVYRKGSMLDPAQHPEIFGTDPAKYPKNRYQWRMVMTGYLTL